MFSTHEKPQTQKKPLLVLMVTGMYPTEQKPHACTFIKTQVDSLIAEGVEVEVIHPRRGPLLIRYISASIQVFLKTLKGRFDVVNGHYAHWCLAARMQWTTPVVASFLGGDLLGELYADGGLSKRAILFRRISRWMCYWADAVIVKTEEMKRAAPGSKVYVIPNGVDFTLFHPIPRAEARAALGWDQDRCYVLFGNNPNEYRKNFPLAQATIERLHTRGIAAELVVASGLPQTTVMHYINASNALLLPSMYEGSPNIVKETMACNVPVVATDVGDVSQVIGHTKGCAVCSSDPDALAAGLEVALRHTEPTTGRRDIAHLEASVVAKQVIALFEQVASKKAKHEGSAAYFQEEKVHG
jgi:glycosyltransferase involved in cell wall biosynthesis